MGRDLLSGEAVADLFRDGFLDCAGGDWYASWVHPVGNVDGWDIEMMLGPGANSGLTQWRASAVSFDGGVASAERGRNSVNGLVWNAVGELLSGPCYHRIPYLEK